MPAERDWVTPSSHTKKKKVKFTKPAASPNPNRDTAPSSTGAKPVPRGQGTNPFAPLGEKTGSTSSENALETQEIAAGAPALDAEDDSPADEAPLSLEKSSTGPPNPSNSEIEDGEVVSCDADIPDSVARALLDALQEKRRGNQLPVAMAPLARVRASQLQHCITNGTEPPEATIQATLDIVAMESGPADPAALADKVSMVSQTPDVQIQTTSPAQHNGSNINTTTGAETIVFFNTDQAPQIRRIQIIP
jgi:hypothetical protein